MEYVTSKEDCAKRISGVCHRCGSKVAPIETVDNAGSPTFWSGCTECHHFTDGTEKNIYEICKALVDRGEQYYSYDGEPEDKESGEYKYWYESQVGGFNNLVRFVVQMSNKQESDSKGGE